VEVPVQQPQALATHQQLRHLKATMVGVQVRLLTLVTGVVAVVLLRQDRLEQHLQLRVATAVLEPHLVFLAHP
jgi:hypothetical protein